MHIGLVATGAAFLLQSATALAWMTLPVLAPQVALSAGVAPNRVGEVAGLMFVGALVANMFAARVVAVVGALRTIQLGVLIAAAGLLVAQIGQWPLIIAGAVIIGLGYGAGVPAASHLLARHTAANHRGLVFSIKQSGVPVGGFIAGLTLPALALLTDWRWAVIAASAFCVLIALLVEAMRSRLDNEERVTWRSQWQGYRWRAPIIADLRVHADLPWLTYNGFAAAALQGATFALLVTFLVVEGQLDLVTAGFAFAVMHVSGAIARILLGITSDRLIPPQPLLAFLAVIGAGGIFLLAVAAGDLPHPVIFVLVALVGATVSGWNGVYMAEVARLAPLARVSQITASSVALVFVGYISGPLFASAIIATTGSYEVAFGTLALVLLMAPMMRLRRALHRLRTTIRNSPG